MTPHDVEIAIIQPMLAAFPAPTHVRGNREATEALLDVYRRALGHFDRPTLEQAWQKVAAEQTYWVWPLPEAVVKAALTIHNRTHPKAADPDAWIEKAQGLAEQYVRRFMRTSAHAERAIAGGYKAELVSYVRAAAYVQAQALAGHRGGISYESSVLFTQGEDAEERKAWLYQQQEQAVERDAIKVTVPPTMLKLWQEKAQQGSRSR